MDLVTNLSLDLTRRKDQNNCFLVFHYCEAPTSEDNKVRQSEREIKRIVCNIPGLRLVCKVITRRGYTLWK